MEKLCSALSLCWLKKIRFRMVKDICSRLLPVLEAACPSVSRDLQVKSLPCRDGLLRVSMQSVSSLLTPCRWPAGSLCWWRLPSIQNFFYRNFHQKSKRWWQWAWKKASFSWAWAASEGMFVELTAYSRSSGYDRYVAGWILKLFFTRLILEMSTDQPTKVCENKCPVSGKAYMLKGEF